MKPTRIIFALLAFLLIFTGAGMAQAKANLVIQSNVSGAQVYVDGRLFGNAAPGLTLSLPQRTYQIKVSKPGYQDFNTTVNLGPSGAIVQANLIAIGQPPAPAPTPAPPPATSGKPTLSVTSNPPSASVFVNGSMMGLTPYSGQYTPGTYKVSVRRSGYQDYNQTVVLSSSTQLNINLVSNQPAPPPPPVNLGLSVNGNVPGAEVLLNGSSVGRIPFNTQVPQGSYNVTVRAPGYADFNQSIIVNGPTQINANLQAIQVGLSVNANVMGAEVYLNGSLAGRTPLNLNVVPGSYNLTVRAPGYADYNQSIVVNGATQINANLQPNQVGLSVNANVQGAEVFLNGSRVGNVPFSLNVIPGSYNVTVRAPGYGDYNQSVVVSGPTQVNAVLVGVMSSWQINVPDNMVNKDMKGGHWSQIQVYLDGNLQRGPSGQVGAGRHVIRVTSGGMAVELVFDAQPGRSYSFEPYMGINVK